MNGNARAPRATSASHASYPSTDTAHGWESFPIAAARASASATAVPPPPHHETHARERLALLSRELGVFHCLRRLQ